MDTTTAPAALGEDRYVKHGTRAQLVAYLQELAKGWWLMGKRESSIAEIDTLIEELNAGAVEVRRGRSTYIVMEGDSEPASALGLPNQDA
ncbi:hypothetical protein [Streptomyces sp. NPDC051546]|uniref:hypothetical protein n=1 Tax=Streptomyces sp. NPDC051546 TaxID=3365655 RepID=UPI0037BDF994